jgi:hypothetical protein
MSTPVIPPTTTAPLTTTSAPSTTTEIVATTITTAPNTTTVTNTTAAKNTPEPVRTLPSPIDLTHFDVGVTLGIVTKFFFMKLLNLMFFNLS